MTLDACLIANSLTDNGMRATWSKSQQSGQEDLSSHASSDDKALVVEVVVPRSKNPDLGHPHPAKGLEFGGSYCDLWGWR